MGKNKTNERQAAGELANKARPDERAAYSFRLVVAIVERGSADEIVEVLQEKLGIQFHITCQGDGTADSAILQLLNLDKSAKDVVFCVVDAAQCDSVLQQIQQTYDGGGIAFSIKLSSIGGMRTLKLLGGELPSAKQDSPNKNKE